MDINKVSERLSRPNALDLVSGQVPGFPAPQQLAASVCVCMVLHLLFDLVTTTTACCRWDPRTLLYLYPET